MQNNQNGHAANKVNQKKPDKDRLSQLAQPRNSYKPIELKTEFEISDPQIKKSLIHLAQNVESLDKLKYK